VLRTNWSTGEVLDVEEPENQLYPSLLWDLAEEFRAYAARAGQVFVTTHSPDFLNAMTLEEVFWLVKENGYPEVRRAGDQMGFLCKSNLLAGANPT